MSVPALIHELVLKAPARQASRTALVAAPGAQGLSYGELAEQVERCRGAFSRLGLRRGARVAVFLEKRLEMVIAILGATAAGGVMVPMNPGLKPEQVRHVLDDAQPQVWVTSNARWDACRTVLERAWSAEFAGGMLGHVVTVEGAVGGSPSWLGSAGMAGPEMIDWTTFMALPPAASPRVIESDLAALLYTSGSTGRPKGVMLSHRNLVVGARSVVEYLDNGPDDALLAVLPLSFDAGLSQLTTAFTVGARAVLLNHLLPQDAVRALSRERITGLTVVPPLLHQLLGVPWPEDLDEHLRYVATTGGPMPVRTLQALRARLPRSRPFIMYGLTEAFRSTFLPPEELDRCPGSIGRAIPNVEVLVLRPDGSECLADEPGELVHRGPLVGQGYWRDPERTALRFRPLPEGVGGRLAGQVLPETVVYSGDRVVRDARGFLYHLGREDEMIKTSGYRVSPTEVEEVLQAHPLVDECVAYGVPDEALGQRVAVVVVLAAPSPAPGSPTPIQTLQGHCRQHLPTALVPQDWQLWMQALPRNANGKIDRVAVVAQARPGPPA